MSISNNTSGNILGISAAGVDGALGISGTGHPKHNPSLVHQNSETEYLIDPDSSVGMLILKPTNQYSPTN